MIKNNPNFNYHFYDKLFELKQHESDTIFDTVQLLMETFAKVYNSKSTNRGVYYIDKEIKYTTDIDPTYCLSMRYAIGTVQDFYIDLPLIQNGDTILINGNIYNPMLQMIDKPLYLKGKTKSAVLQTNLGIFTTTEINDDKVVKLNVTGFGMFHPPILLYFCSYLGGLKGFEERTGIRYDIEPGCENVKFKDYIEHHKFLIDKSNIKPEYRDSKFDILANQINKIFMEWKWYKKERTKFFENHSVKEVFDLMKTQEYCSAWLAEFITGSNLKKFNCHQELVTKFDIFSRHFMVYKTVPEELFRAFTTSAQYLDMKDLTNKRFRCYELYLLTFLKHIYNLGMNTLYSKIATVSKEKRLRIYDNIRASTSSNMKDSDGKSPAYSYDGGRNNSIMRLTEMTKINQTGEGGLTAEMFVGAARDLHDSQYGTLCPITTPDREKCGVTLYLCPSNLTKFPDMYYWPEKDEDNDNREKLLTSDDYKNMMAEVEKLRKKQEPDIVIPDESENDDLVKEEQENSSDHVDTGDDEDSNSLFLNKDMNEGDW